MLTRFLERLADVAHRHYRTVFAVSAAVTLVSLWLARGIRIDADVLSLLPQKDPAVATFRETLRDFGSMDTLLVVVRVPEGAAVDPYLSFVDELAGELARLPQIRAVEHRLGNLEELLAAFLPRAMLFLDEAARAEVARRLSDEGLRVRAAELRRQIATPAGMATKELLRVDPLGLSEVLLASMRGTRGALQVDWQSGYFLSPDRRLLLLLAKPVRPPQDIDFDEELVAAVGGAVAAAQARWPELSGNGGAPPRVDLGGGYIIALSDGTLIKQDIVLNVVGSFGTVLPLFWYAFRRFGTLLFAVVPLVVGIAATAGLTGLVLDTVSAATTGCAALLVGLAIDFVFVAYGRYAEERRNGATREAAMRIMGGKAGRGIVTGAVTTTVTFYAFFVTDFRGLREMGFLTGTGILFCVLAVLLLVPALQGWKEDRQLRRARRRGEPEEIGPGKLRVHAFGVERLAAWSLRHAGAVLWASLAVTVVLALFIGRVRFEDRVQNMRPKGNRGIVIQDEVVAAFGSGFEQMMLVIRGDSAEQVLALADRATRGAEELVRDGVLVGVSSVTSLVPSPERQRVALDWLASGRAAGGPLDVARVRATFEGELRAQGLNPAGFARGLDLAAGALGAVRPITLGDFAASEQTRTLLERFVRRTNGGWRSVVYLYPPPKVWKRQAPPEVTRFAAGLGPQVQLTGINVVSERVRVGVTRDAVVAAILGTLLILAILAADFRRVGEAVLASIPLVLGLVWMVGAMGAIGVSMNFMNVFVVTMIIGIGIDYGIHVVHRFRDEEARGEDPGRGVGEIAKAVTLAALGTIFGFGSMITSHYPGIQSVGYAAVLGTGACVLVAVTTLPAALELAARRRRRG